MKGESYLAVFILLASFLAYAYFYDPLFFQKLAHEVRDLVPSPSVAPSTNYTPPNETRGRTSIYDDDRVTVPSSTPTPATTPTPLARVGTKSGLTKPHSLANYPNATPHVFKNSSKIVLKYRNETVTVAIPPRPSIPPPPKLQSLRLTR